MKFVTVTQFCSILLAAEHLSFAGAQSTTSSSSSNPSSPTSSLTTSAASASGTVIVDQAGNGQFTAINPAISYAQTFAQPTVIVRAGTYNEAVVVPGSAPLTILGDSSSPSDYAQNQVTISHATLPMSINTGAVKGITWKNINFVNSATTIGTNPAVSLRGTKNAFYNCKFVSPGANAITSTLGITLIANSYIEGTDKLFYGYNGIYIFGSTVVPTVSSSNIVFAQGYGTPLQYSQTVFDSCNILQKPGATNSYVYLAAANGAGVQVVYKFSNIAGFIAPTGTRAVGVNGFFGEYATTGAGSYKADRVDTLMTSSMLTNYTIDYVFANSFTGYTTPTTSWIDASVLQAVAAANVISDTSSSLASSSLTTTSSLSSAASSSQSTTSVDSTTSSSLSPSIPSTQSSSTTSTTTNNVPSFSTTSALSTSASESSTSSSAVVSSSTDSSLSLSNVSSSTWDSSTLSSSSILSSTTSASTTISSTSTACTLPASIPSTAYVVGPSDSCAKYSTLASAIAALPAGSTSEYIYILAGTYTEQIPTFNRVGPTIFRGESTSPLDQASNTVTVQFSGSVLSSAGGSEEKAVFRSTQYNAKKYAFYNINFVNTAAQTPNYIAIAMDIKAQQVGFYACGFLSGQGTFLANLGTAFLSGCRIEGSSDFLWGYGAVYVSNSQIVTNAAGNSIAAQNFVAAYPSQFVFDHCAFVPKTSSIGQSTTYLGRDYSTSARVAVLNSFLDGHIAPAGWSIKSPATTNVTFAEFNNTGPGYVPASRLSQVQSLSDGSAYSLSSVLGDASWIDSSAVVPFAGFPASLFSTTPISSTASSTSTATPSPTASSPPSSTYVVSLEPNATEYRNVSAAVAALPNDGLPKVILVKPGTYEEQVAINRVGKVTLRGLTSFPNDYSKNEVTIKFNYGVSTSAGQNELTPVLYSKKTDGSGLSIYNINFINTFPQTRNYAALAADFYGDNMAAYGCSFIGFQDTLLANKGTQLFSNCYIEGSVDYIWGFSTAYFHKCYLASNTPGASISAQSRPSLTAAGGYIFDSCLVTYTSAYGTSMGQTYLGRPYSQYSIAVYKNSYLDTNINAAGWQVWQTSNPQTDNVLFGEYNNVGPGAWTSSTQRASFATKLNESQAAAYDLIKVFASISWIDFEAYNLEPSFNFTIDGVNGANTTKPTESQNSTWTRPTTGSLPPTGAVTVSVGGVQPGSFANLTVALASLPVDTTNQTIFIYSGTYTEQFSINRPGPVMIIGQKSDSLGKNYAGNTVTITFARGLSVAVPQPGHTNAETAVIATASNQISVYNVDFINTDNLDGAIPSYVTLAASVYGDKIGFYGCSFVGWQDTLLTGNPSGYAYYESCYIEGAIDFIWGYSLSYFKGCTLGAQKAKSCITAQNRQTSSAIGGYIFDQCLFTAAPSSTVDLTEAVYLGRPYSQYAKVIIKHSYLDYIIQPSGWKIWSASDPRINGATFAEYQNTGPGNWENNTDARVAFGNATLLISDAYTLENVMASTSWIDKTYWSSIITPQPAKIVLPPSNSVGNSTSPADGACIVSKTAIPGKTVQSTIAGCISSLPATSALATIFIYPGVYEEQLTFNRSGPTIFRGYANAPDSFTSNQVTITNAVGVDTQADQSNSDSATFYSRGKNVKFYNVNLVNKFGTTQDFASLGFSVGNNGFASFYGCQIIGNQDTLQINVGASLFAYNSYVEGSVDFIWGSGSAYFLSSTISPNVDSISITAHKRATNSSVGGIVFDQCKVTPSTAGASNPKITSSVTLGRPWNSYARVAYIKSYLDTCVNPVGWIRWSSSSPNTDGVFFGEYQNTGPRSTRTSRTPFSHEMPDSEAVDFQLANFFATTSWIDTDALKVSPFIIAPPFVTVTSTIYPTASNSVVTTTLTQVSVLTIATPTTTVLKGFTEKLTTLITATEPDVYRSTSVTLTSTSLLLITPPPKITTTTLDERVFSTQTIQGPASTLTEVKISKITGFVTSTAPDVTRTKTESILETFTQVITPKDVTQVITSIQTQISTTFFTPRIKSITQTMATTISQQFTAPTPINTVTESSASTIFSLETIIPKAITRTETLVTTLPAGPTVTIKAKAVTSLLSFTSTVMKTVKTTTTLSCVPSTPPKVKRGLQSTPCVKRDGASTVTVLYTIPVSVRTTTFIEGSTQTTTIASGKTTVTETITSLIPKTTIQAGQTFLQTVSTTKVISKTSTIPQSTSTLLVNLQGTEIATRSIPGAILTQTEVLLSTVKINTITEPGKTFLNTVTEIQSAATKTTLQVSTLYTTTYSVRTLTVTSILPTPTSTFTEVNTIFLKSTITPAASFATVQKVRTTNVVQTTSLDASTRIITKTSTESEPAPSVTITPTVIKSTTIKSTKTVYSTATKTAKNAPTCA